MAGPQVSFSGFGKNDVRLMKIRKDGDQYFVTEFTVNTELQLSSVNDYVRGDNRDVVATDSQKNTVLIFAKQNDITSPEQFGLLLSNHFLRTYKQVIRCKIYIEQAPWQRIKQGGAEHAHAFISEPSATRFCYVTQDRRGSPKVSGGVKDVKVLKTTQSGFEGFVRDRFTILPETNDRTFCTNIYLKYDYCTDLTGVDFNGVWETVKNAILDVFAGPPVKGIYSPSVQNTMHDTAKLIFARVPSINDVEINMPNIHYFVADLSKLKIPNSGELLLPSSSPHGIINAVFSRSLKFNAKL